MDGILTTLKWEPRWLEVMRVAIFVPLLLLAAALAGCSDGSDPEPTTTTPPPPPTGPVVVRGLAVQAEKVINADGGGFEPSIEVALDGVIYVTAAQGVVIGDLRASRLWVSADNGTTFTEVQPVDPDSGVSNLPFGAEGDLAVNAKNHAYYVDLTLASTTVARSTDQGKTWELRNPAAFAAGGGDREWVAAGPADDVAVTWNNVGGSFSPDDSRAGSLWVAVSKDGGMTFPVQTPVPDAGLSAAGGIDMGMDGTILVGRTPGPVLGFVSTDGGASFTRTVVRESPGATYLFAFPAIDANGTLYMTWVEESEGTSQAFYAYSTNQGGNWSEPIQVSHHDGAAAMAHIDAAGKGRIAIAYTCAPRSPGIPDAVEGDWHVCVTDIHNADSATPTLDIVQLTTKPVQSGPICTNGLACESGRELGDYLQVAIAPDESIHVAFSDKERNVHWAVAS